MPCCTLGCRLFLFSCQFICDEHRKVERTKQRSQRATDVQQQQAQQQAKPLKSCLKKTTAGSFRITEIHIPDIPDDGHLQFEGLGDDEFPDEEGDADYTWGKQHETDSNGGRPNGETLNSTGRGILGLSAPNTSAVTSTVTNADTNTDGDLYKYHQTDRAMASVEDDSRSDGSSRSRNNHGRNGRHSPKNDSDKPPLSASSSNHSAGRQRSNLPLAPPRAEEMQREYTLNRSMHDPPTGGGYSPMYSPAAKPDGKSRKLDASKIVMSATVIPTGDVESSNLTMEDIATATQALSINLDSTHDSSPQPQHKSREFRTDERQSPSKHSKSRRRRSSRNGSSTTSSPAAQSSSSNSRSRVGTSTTTTSTNSGSSSSTNDTDGIGSTGSAHGNTNGNSMLHPSKTKRRVRSSASASSVGTSASGPGRGARLSWKSDPSASFSDWTVIVIREEMSTASMASESTTDTASALPEDVYHLHRNVLGFGVRKSKYFCQQFQQRNTNNGVTTLRFIPAKADVFPMVLDFLYYTKEAKQTLSAERACAVFTVADFLQIIPLQKAIIEFYRKNLSLTNMGEFLAYASQYNAKQLLTVSKAKIGSLLTEKPQLAGLVPPHFLASILETSQQHMQDLHRKDPSTFSKEWMAIQSKNWSKAATICIVHNDMEASLFDKLTDEQTLPAIDTSVAHELLMADAKLHETTSISNLQRRCIRSITQNWDEFQSGYKSSDDVSEALGNLPSHVLADILVKSMAQPKRNGAAAKAEASADDDSKRMGDANDVRGAESDDQDSHLDDDDE